jgi:tetratricopeptide (TPR) repeat protein
MKEAGLRSRWPRYQVTLGVAGVIIGAGAAAVAKWPHAWWWLIVVLVAAAAVMPPALTALSQASRQRREIGRAARAGLQGTTKTGGGKLPAAETADLEVRVHQTVLSMPYIHRDEEATVRARLRAGRPVLLIGSSMVGKTKMAARVIADEFGSWPVAIPDSKTALADLDAKDVMLQNSVIWLDDIERLIGTGGITDGALRRLAAAGNIIVGTIRARAYDGFRPSDQLRLPEWDVLSVFEHVFISRDLTQEEQERLAVAVEDPDILNRIRIVGLGEYVGAAGQVAEALKLGAAGTAPHGYALVLAAADWRRCGMTRPVPSSLLVPLAEPHLDDRGRAQLADLDTFSAALAWATRDINPNVALLQPGGTDSYVVYDYALDLISAQDAPIPDSNWAVIMANADTPELMDLGYTAHNVHHRSEIAAQAWRILANSEHSDQALRATFNLGWLLEEQGDVPGAKAAYQKVIDSGHADLAPVAAANLGMLLAKQGDVPGAKAAYQKAIDSGHATAVPLGATGLGMLLTEQGDMPGAKAAYQKVIDSGHADLAPVAAGGLGELLEREGDVPGAKEAYQKAIDSGHAEVAAKAAADLGRLQERGDVPGIEAAD